MPLNYLKLFDILFKIPVYLKIFKRRFYHMTWDFHFLIFSNSFKLLLRNPFQVPLNSLRFLKRRFYHMTWDFHFLNVFKFLEIPFKFH